MTPTFHRLTAPTRRHLAMTMVEILIASIIITVCGLSILASIQTAILFQQSIREENGATRAAADMIDRTRRELFFRLESWQEEVVIDDRGTPNLNDDITAIAIMRFYAPDEFGDYFDSNGQYLDEVGTENNPLPMDLTMVIAEVTVRWNRNSRLTNPEREIILSALLAP